MKNLVSILVVLILSMVSCSKIKEVHSKNPNLPEKKEVVKEESFNIPDFSAVEISKKIWQNEFKKGTTEGLIQWNENEDFLRLGIGHFVWKNPSSKSKEKNELPELIQYIRNNSPEQNIPNFLTLKFSPWENREKVYAAKKIKGELMQKMEEFFDKTFKTQSQFIFDKTIQFINTYHDQRKITTLAQTKQGFFVIADYLNFKGESSLVLTLDRTQDPSVSSFIESAKETIKQEVQRDPNKKIWLNGWINRVESYSSS